MKLPFEVDASVLCPITENAATSNLKQFFTSSFLVFTTHCIQFPTSQLLLL